MSHLWSHHRTRIKVLLKHSLSPFKVRKLFHFLPFHDDWLEKRRSVAVSYPATHSSLILRLRKLAPNLVVMSRMCWDLNYLLIRWWLVMTFHQQQTVRLSNNKKATLNLLTNENPTQHSYNSCNNQQRKDDPHHHRYPLLGCQLVLIGQKCDMLILSFHALEWRKIHTVHFCLQCKKDLK